VIVQSVVTEQSAELSTEDDWNDADSTAGFDIREDGTVRLSGGQTDLLDQTADNQASAIQGPFPSSETLVPNLFCAGIVFDVGGVIQPSPDFVLDSIEAELDPAFGGSQEVAEWVCRLYVQAEPDNTELDPGQRLVPISSNVVTTAGGSVARVTFDFTGANVRPASYRSQVYVTIYGIQSDGSPAGNCGWRSDNTSASYTENGHVLTGRSISIDPITGTATIGSAGAVPNIKVVQSSYAAATLTFDTGSPPTLAATPTGTVEFSVLFQEPSGSSLVAQVRNDADTAWVTFEDGDTTDDLAGVGKRQTYEVQFIFTPGTGTTPILSRFEVRELDRTDLDDLATVIPRGAMAIDPIRLRGEIMEYDIEIIRDGVRDYRDFISDLLSTTDIDGIEFELYMGHPDLDRSDWLLLDRALVDDHEDFQSKVVVKCLSANRELEQPIPQVKGTGSSLTSDPLTYSGQTLKAVYDDVLANQIDLASRFIGPGVGNTSVTVTNEVDKGTARELLDAIAYIDGGGVIASQGQIQFRQLYASGAKEIAAIWPKEEVAPQSVSPGAGSPPW